MILRNYSKIIKKTNKEKKMIKNHDYRCKGLVKIRTKNDDDIQYIWIETSYKSTSFADFLKSLKIFAFFSNTTLLFSIIFFAAS